VTGADSVALSLAAPETKPPIGSWHYGMVVKVTDSQRSFGDGDGDGIDSRSLRGGRDYFFLDRSDVVLLHQPVKRPPVWSAALT
jgi:hypothetical protein